MEDVKYLKNDLEGVRKPEHKELLIIPKKEFMDWYKYTRGVMEDIEMKRNDNNDNFQECPSCRTKMENQIIKTSFKEELWHFCPKCNLTFTKKQRDYLTKIILGVINNE